MSNSENITVSLPEPHRIYCKNTIQVLREYEVVDALIGTGSLATGTINAMSDLDFIVVIAANAYEDVIETDRFQMASRIGDLVSAYPGDAAGEPRLLNCLYANPLFHLDLKFVVREDLNHFVAAPILLWSKSEEIYQLVQNAEIGWPERAPDWFEQRVWDWLFNASVKLTNGEYFEVLNLLNLVRTNVLGPMFSRRHHLAQRGVRMLDDLPQAMQLVGAGIRGPSHRELALGIKATAKAYINLRKDRPPPSPRSDVVEAIEYIIDERQR